MYDTQRLISTPSVPTPSPEKRGKPAHNYSSPAKITSECTKTLALPYKRSPTPAQKMASPSNLSNGAYYSNLQRSTPIAVYTHKVCIDRATTVLEWSFPNSVYTNARARMTGLQMCLRFLFLRYLFARTPTHVAAQRGRLLSANLETGTLLTFSLRCDTMLAKCLLCSL